MTKISYHLGDVRTILRKEKPSHLRIVTSRNLFSKLNWVFKELGIKKSEIIFVPAGEQAKEWNVLQKLMKDFSKAGLDRQSIVIVLGGGTIGDLVGFAASIYLRGIRYIQIPTTIVSQVDSALGGKTGINFLGAKNQIGTLYEPIAVVSDFRFLRLLPQAQVIDGLGEIIKCGLIHDPSILSILSKNFSWPGAREVVKKAIAVKKFYTDKDFRDEDLRNMLNFGHTYGHSIELKYHLSHGYAVIIGMLHELDFTESLGLTPPSIRANLVALLKHVDIWIDKKYRPDVRLMMHDKKVVGDSIMLPIVTKEGVSKIIKVKLSTLKKFAQKL